MAQWIESLRQRGLVYQHTPLPEAPHLIKAAYVGIDPTADSLHVGHLVPLQLLYHLAQLGIQPIVVIGGATARIGDPSGKRTERPLLPPEVVELNTQQLIQQVQKILPLSLTILDNYAWLGEMSLVSFLRDVGKHITVSYLLTKETIHSRLEGGISFTEFSYPLLQAYDFYHLFVSYGCSLQVGGADQWGNITTGIEFIHKQTGGEAYGITCPLLTRADGSKFGKSEQGENIWLSASKTSPYKFYQFWIRQPDADMLRLLSIFSFRTLEEIHELWTMHQQSPEQRLAQRALAYEMTSRVHGEAAAKIVKEVSEVVYGVGSLEALENISEGFFEQIVAEMPTYIIASSEISVAEALVQSGFLRSKSECRQLIQQGGLSINRQRVRAENTPLSAYKPLRERYWLLQRGKKHQAWLRAELRGKRESL
ncbi:MAG: tyrosine--tRNA ligase [Bacteroidia bacterium]|nr:tyrosine--tRNA ligase [Bacteroidia bacterium]MDW8134093.1 tyrosine--tRNA ligase [Bacteroidia bacterium]